MNHHDPILPHAEPHPAMAGAGKLYWRGLEELAQSEAFQQMVHREFRVDATSWADPVTRRQFLTLMAASLAMAGLTGCSPQPPVRKIMPYARQPEQIVPGKPQFFATAMTLGGLATGLIVKSHEGRPTKIEGNPKHPASLGASDAFSQAAVLGLYDPDRSQTIACLGQPRGWTDAKLVLRKNFQRLRERGGQGLRLLTGAVSSPTLLDQLDGDRRGSLAREFPEARWIQHEPAESDAVLAGARLAFGQNVVPVFDFTKADVVVSLDCDFLSCRSAGVRYSRDFMDRRRVTDGDAARARADRAMNRLYVVECTPSITGAVADHRLPLRMRDIEMFARALAAELKVAGVRATGADSKLPPEQRRWIAAITKDFAEHPNSSLVIAADGQPAGVHALVHAINDAIGAAGKTVSYIRPPQARPSNQSIDLAELSREMEAGEVDTLLICGANPVYTAPADLNFQQAVQKVPLRVHLGLYRDESAGECHWHIPEPHFLETWSDARAYDGTVSIVQPLIAPLYNGRSLHELISALVEEAERPGYEIVRSYWKENWPDGTRGSEFESAWEQALRKGVIDGTTFEPRTNLSARRDWDRSEDEPNAAVADADSIEIVFRADPTIYDGRFANNGWLQELPKPITKLTWDNAAFIGPRLAEKLGLSQTFGSSGGEHGQAIVDRVQLTLHGRSVEAPVWILPGHADNSVTVNLGYGRTQAGRVGSGVGFDGYKLRSAKSPWFDDGLQIRKLGDSFTLACTQVHHAMEERQPVREGTYQEFHANRNFLAGKETELHQWYQAELVPGVAPATNELPHDPRLEPLTLYSPANYDLPKNRWGMSIDLTSCTGCSACVLACQAENNIPVVGKTEVTRGREMHWLRIDRYYRGDLENPSTYMQPVPCMHCENAPCEIVCPVAATVHSADGLNDMVYNRCVGTRYCSNNCPYKVRRFNFLPYSDFTTESLKLGRNPQVTVRSRGVMEKCTYCVQRIRNGQIQSEITGEPIRDGDVMTACQQACPTRAIVFGDMNDQKSAVARHKAEPLSYGLLAELNTRPRTTYLAALRNPNPELESAAAPGGTG